MEFANIPFSINSDTTQQSTREGCVAVVEEKEEQRNE